MKLKGYVSAVLLLFVLNMLLICAVGCEERITYEYTDEYVNILMLSGNSTLICQDMQVTEAEGNKYYFDRWVSLDDRADYIKNQKKIFDLLSKNGIKATGFSIYVLPDATNQAVGSKSSMYISVSSSGTVDQINLTLQMIFGEYTNYGYIFSLSDHMAGKLRWRGYGDFELNESLFSGKPELLNLAYPCFTTDYYGESEISACKALSKHILSKMPDAYGGEEEFLSALDGYIKEKSFDVKRSYLTFAFGDADCLLKIKTEFLEVFLDEDYEGSCMLTEKSIAEDPMFNFKNMIDFWELADSDIADVRSRFDFHDDYTVPVFAQDINRGLPQGGDIAGLFVPNGLKLILEDVYTITHEYTHYIDHCVDEDNTDDNWCTEVLACYFGKNMSYIERLVRAESGDENVWTVEQLSEFLGTPYDSVEDEILFMSIMNAYEENPKYAVTGLYNGRLSFGNYFALTYGEEAFIKCMLTPASARSIIGCTVNDVLDNWVKWLEKLVMLNTSV